MNKMLSTITRYLVVTLFFATPYISIAADRFACAQRGYMAIGGEVFIPLICYAGLFMLLEIDDKLNPKRRK